MLVSLHDVFNIQREPEKVERCFCDELKWEKNGVVQGNVVFN